MGLITLVSLIATLPWQNVENGYAHVGKTGKVRNFVCLRYRSDVSSFLPTFPSHLHTTTWVNMVFEIGCISSTTQTTLQRPIRSTNHPLQPFCRNTLSEQTDRWDRRQMPTKFHAIDFTQILSRKPKFIMLLSTEICVHIPMIFVCDAKWRLPFPPSSPEGEGRKRETSLRWTVACWEGGILGGMCELCARGTGCNLHPVLRADTCCLCVSNIVSYMPNCPCNWRCWKNTDRTCLHGKFRRRTSRRFRGDTEQTRKSTLNYYLYIIWELLYTSACYLLWNGAEYGGEILHADACRRYVTLELGLLSTEVIVVKKINIKFSNVNKPAINTFGLWMVGRSAA